MALPTLILQTLTTLYLFHCVKIISTMPVKTSPPMTAEDLLKWPYLELGDMIQFNVPEAPFKRHHWAIYIGNGKIIHFTTETSVFKAKKDQKIFLDDCKSFCGYVQ